MFNIVRIITMKNVFPDTIALRIGTYPLIIVTSMLHFFVTATKKLPLRASNIRQTIFCGQFGRNVVVVVVVVADRKR